jgi:hypothetical protein
MERKADPAHTDPKRRPGNLCAHAYCQFAFARLQHIGSTHTQGSRVSQVAYSLPRLQVEGPHPRTRRVHKRIASAALVALKRVLKREATWARYGYLGGVQNEAPTPASLRRSACRDQEWSNCARHEMLGLLASSLAHSLNWELSECSGHENLSPCLSSGALRLAYF